jgi:predicted nucleic acid-binding protein
VSIPPKKTRVVVDSTYLLPSLGISVKGLEAEDIQLIRRLRERIEYCYPAPLLAELVAKAAREASKKGLRGLPREAVDGFRALLVGLDVAVESPEPDSLEIAAELWIRGHRDIMDNMAYAHAVKTQAYFMTLDETFRRFLSEKGYSLDAVITHRELEKVTRES